MFVNKIYIILILLFSSFIGQAKPQVEVVYSNNEYTEVILTFEEPSLTYNNEETNVSLNGCKQLLQLGAPALPYFTFSINVPNNTVIETKVLEEDFFDYKLNKEIAASYGKRLRSKQYEKPVKNNTYYSNSFYPNKLAENGADFIIRNKRGQSVLVYPLQYKANNNTLRFYKKIKLLLTHKNGLGENIIQEQEHAFIPMAFDNIFNRFFVNYDYQKNQQKNIIEEEGSMLLLVTTANKNLIAPFVAWKIKKGIPVEIVNVDTIAGGNNYPNLKAFINNYYNTHSTLAFVLIIGDHTAIPTYNENGANANFYSYGDNGYALIKGSDHFADVLIGRLSGSTTDQINSQINKILIYEKNNTVGNWLTTCVAVGSNDATKGNDDQYDWQHERAIADTLMNFGTYKARVELFDGDKGGLDAPGNVTPQQVVDAINNGVGLINYTGHGNTFGINTSQFSVTQIPLLNNNNGTWPFMITVGCSPGTFLNVSCFAEELAWATDINGRPTGTIANVMSTVDQYWDEPMQAQDEMNNIIAGVYNNNIKNTFGGIFFNGLYSMQETYDIPTDPTGGSDMADAWQLFGDPSTSFKTELKDSLRLQYPCVITTTTNNLSITCDVNDVLVTLMHEQKIIATNKINGGVANLSFTNVLFSEGDTIEVTGTKNNYKTSFGSLKITNQGNNCIPLKTTIKQNITSNNVVLESPKKIKELAVFNLRGQKIIKTLLSNEPYTTIVNLEGVAPGFYYLSAIFSDNTKEVFKINKY